MVARLLIVLAMGPVQGPQSTVLRILALGFRGLMLLGAEHAWCGLLSHPQWPVGLGAAWRLLDHGWSQGGAEAASLPSRWSQASRPSGTRSCPATAHSYLRSWKVMRKEKRRRTQRQTPRFEVGRAGKGGRDVLMALLGLGWGNATHRPSLARAGPCPLLMGGRVWLPPWGWKGRAAPSPAPAAKGHLCLAVAEGAQPAFGVQAAVRRHPHPPCMVHSFPSLGISLNLYSDGFNAFQKREGGLTWPSADFPRPHPWGPLGQVGGGLPSRPRPTAGLDPFCGPP